MSPPHDRLPESSRDNARALFLLKLRRSRKRKTGDDCAVDLSPLIDCVFLLLIFFLVTTMLKRLEKQIPVVLPDSTASLADIAVTEEVIFSIDNDGLISEAIDRHSRQGLRYQPLDNFDARLKEIAEARGVNVPVRVDAQREVGFQKVVDMLDILAIQGFEQVGVRLHHREDEYFELRDIRGGRR